MSDIDCVSLFHDDNRLLTRLHIKLMGCEPCRDGKAVTLPPVSNRRSVDFGKGVGMKSVYLYSLPEVASGHEVFGVPNISARFGTSPEIWNWAMVAMAKLVPQSRCILSLTSSMEAQTAH